MEADKLELLRRFLEYLIGSHIEHEFEKIGDHVELVREALKIFEKFFDDVYLNSKNKYNNTFHEFVSRMDPESAISRGLAMCHCPAKETKQLTIQESSKFFTKLKISVKDSESPKNVKDRLSKNLYSYYKKGLTDLPDKTLEISLANLKEHFRDYLIKIAFIEYLISEFKAIQNEARAQRF